MKHCLVWCRFLVDSSTSGRAEYILFTGSVLLLVVFWSCFLSMLCHYLFWWEDVQLACKELSIDMLVVVIWLDRCTTYVISCCSKKPKMVWYSRTGLFGLSSKLPLKRAYVDAFARTKSFIFFVIIDSSYYCVKQKRVHLAPLQPAYTSVVAIG